MSLVSIDVMFTVRGRAAKIISLPNHVAGCAFLQSNIPLFYACGILGTSALARFMLVSWYHKHGLTCVTSVKQKRLAGFHYILEWYDWQ